MFGTIRKHQTWLWAIIITFTIISFVYFFSPYTKMNGGQSQTMDFGRINGVKVTEGDYRNAAKEAILHQLMVNGRWPDQNFDELREAYQWLLLIQKQQELGIHPSPDSVTLAAREFMSKFSREKVDPDLFIKQALQPHGLNAADLERYITHFLGLQEMMNAVSQSGRLIPPSEMRMLYERERQDVSTEAVWFSVSNYLASVPTTPATIAEFYTNNLANYRVPARLVINYVAFPATNYFAKIEADSSSNITQMVEQGFTGLRTNFYKGATTPETIKAKIREEIVHENAMMLARKQATLFASEVLKRDKARTAADFMATAAASNLTVKVSEPFTHEEGPGGLHLDPKFLKVLFSLSPSNQIAGPVLGDDAAFVVSYNKQLPSEIPPLDAIKERVVTDCKFSEALSAARQAGLAFRKALVAGLASGKTFAAICLEYKYKPVLLPPFSLSTRTLPEAEDHIDLNGQNGLKQLAYGTAPGKVSEFQITPEGGAIVYVKERLPIDEARMRDEMPAFTRGVWHNRQSEAFNQWFDGEFRRGLRDTPLMQRIQQKMQEQQQGQAPAAGKKS